MSKRKEAPRGRLYPKLVVGIPLFLFFAVALIIRVIPPYSSVFSENLIKFTGNDAYYQMRLVDNLIHNFPHLTTFDPYLIYPGGSGVGTVHFFNWLLAGIIWVISLGSPTGHTIDVIAAYFPAILGALIVIPVFFIGKELAGRWAGLLSAGLVSLMPGEFLGRSIIGFTDQHVAETLFITVTMLFLILAIKAASQRQLTFGHLINTDWATSAKPIIYSLLAGISLGVYLVTWLGALLFVFIISVYLVIQFIIDHLRGRPTDYLCIVGAITLLVAAIMLLPVYHEVVYLVSTVAAVLIPLALSGLSRLLVAKKVRRAYYPLSLLGLGLIAAGALYAISPSLFKTMLQQFSIFTPSGVSLTTSEMQPLLAPQGVFTIGLAWGNFTTSFFLGLFSLGMLIYLVVRRGDAETSLVAVWSLVILAATLGQRRFAYYFAVNASLLTGYLLWEILARLGIKDLATSEVAKDKAAVGRRARPRRGKTQTAAGGAILAITLPIILLFVYVPNVALPNINVVATASQTRFAPSDAWCRSLDWLRQNTPDPFGNPDFYNQLETSNKYRSLSELMASFPNPSGDPNFYYHLEGSYQYPESAYGVLAWWDYGYWITRIAHRIPNANPSQDPRAVTSVARFFTSQNETAANAIAQELGSRYVIIDDETAYVDPRTASGKFWAITLWAQRQPTEFFDVYYQLQQDQLVGGILFYPEYYQSLATRLYTFDGKAVTPTSTPVISYEQRISPAGTPYKQLTSARPFATYEEAEAYVLSQNSTAYRIVGTSPLVSPVPLEALQSYKLIYSSDNSTIVPGMPAIKIFEPVR